MCDETVDSRQDKSSPEMSGHSPADANTVAPSAGRSGGWLRRWRQRLELDGAVAYAVLARVWQVLAGPVSLYVILRCYTPAEQGLFYLFASLVLWHGLIELGLQSIITLMASHEWAKLQQDADGQVIGDAAARMRLAGIAHAAQRWYAGVAILFALVIGGCGYWLIAQKDDGSTTWRGPWLAVMLLTAPSLWMSSRIAILEGCNQLRTIYQLRCLQAIAKAAPVGGPVLTAGRGS